MPAREKKKPRGRPRLNRASGVLYARISPATLEMARARAKRDEVQLWEVVENALRAYLGHG